MLLAAARNPRLKRTVTNHRLTKAVTDRFVAGETLADGMRALKSLEGAGIKGILDQLGENVSSEDQADAACAAYIESLDAIARAASDAHISVKPTQLGLDLGSEGALRRLDHICERAVAIDTVVAIDMESHAYTDATIDLYRRLRLTRDNVVLCVQAYLRRTEADVASLLPADPHIRLCKGAYDEPRSMAFDRHDTDRSYRRLAATLLARTGYTAIATHDSTLVRETITYVEEHGIDRGRFEFQMLYGIQRELQESLARDGWAVRVYIPYGDEWYPYLMRRLAERPANMRFFLEALIRG